MSKPPVLPHGGSGEDFLSGYYPDAPRPWLDLSTGINPWAFPFLPVSDSAWRVLPSPAADRACRAAASNYFGVAVQNIAVLPGSQAVISLLPRLFSPTSVSVLEPTYGEHAQCWRQGGHDLKLISADRIEASDASVLVLTNPNNPDGKNWPASQIERLARARTAHGKWLIVDEAFVDVIPDTSAAGFCADLNLIVLRSFGKFFGLAGVRLGFALSPEPQAKALEEMIGPWAVSGPALEIGARAYADRKWHTEMREHLDSDMHQLLTLLTRHGLVRVGGTSLFSLMEHHKAAVLFEHLCDAGIYVRRFAQNPNWLRFGLTSNLDGSTRLESALQRWAKQT